MRPASILITDDESGIRLMLRTALESDGYAVTEASNGREALEAIKTSTPDLMVLDLNMPVLDGMAVLEQMKALAAGIARPRVIILTAYGSIPSAVKRRGWAPWISWKSRFRRASFARRSRACSRSRSLILPPTWWWTCLAVTSWFCRASASSCAWPNTKPPCRC